VAITHATVKANGEKGYAAEWNAEHIVTDESKTKTAATFIIAASDSKDKTRADYVCDGIDDHVQINQAINDLPSVGGKIFLLEGTYNITSSIVLNKHSITLEGATKHTTIQTSSNIGIITASGLQNLYLHNFCVLGNFDGDSQTGFDFFNVFFSTFEGIGFYNLGGHGIKAYWCAHCEVLSCCFSDCINYGLCIEESPEFYVDGNYFDSLNIGISCSWETKITNNYFKIMDFAAIRIDGDSNIVANNYIFDCYWGFIRLIQDSSGNIITGNSCEWSDLYGIHCGADCKRNIFSNNLLDNVSDDVITLEGGSDENIVLGNQIENYTGAAIVDDGANNEKAHNIT